MAQSKKVPAKKTKVSAQEAAKKVAKKPVKATKKNIVELIQSGEAAKLMEKEIGKRGRKLIKPVTEKKTPVKRVRKIKVTDELVAADLATIFPNAIPEGLPDDLRNEDAFVETVKQEVAAGWTYPVYTDENVKVEHRMEEQPSVFKRIWNWISK